MRGIIFVVESFKDYLKNIKCLSNQNPKPDLEAYANQSSGWFRVFGTENYIYLERVGSDEKIYQVKYMIQVPDKRYLFERWITTKPVWVTFEEFFEHLPDDAKLEFAFHLDKFRR